MMPDSQYDSWLTVGITDGTQGPLSSIGKLANSLRCARPLLSLIVVAGIRH